MYLDLARELKNCGTWEWRWHKLWLVHLVQSSKDWYRDWKIWKLEDEGRSSKLQHCWDQPEYWEESWKLEDTCWHSNSNKKLSASAGVKNTQKRKKNNSPGIIDTIIIITQKFRNSKGDNGFES